MTDNKIKFQVFLDSNEAVQVKRLADSLADSGLAGSMSETIRLLVRRGLKYSRTDDSDLY